MHPIKSISIISTSVTLKCINDTYETYESRLLIGQSVTVVLHHIQSAISVFLAVDR